MGTLSSLAVSMRKRAEALPTLGNEIAKAGAEAVLTEWLEVMPVDTSEAISNTQIGIGARPAAILPPHFRGHKGSTRTASAEKSRDEALAVLKGKQPGQPVFISNTAKHIGDLDRGTSVQFAGGFVPRGLIVLRLAIRQAAAQLMK